MRTRGLILLLPLALAGCSTVSNNGTSSLPTGPLTAACQQTEQNVTALENNAGKLSNSEWNNPVGDLTGQWNNLRQQLLSAGIPSSQKVSSTYTDLTSEWGNCH